MRKVKPIIRPLERDDIPQIATSFEQLGWNKPASQYERYLVEQEIKARDVYVAFIEVQFTGYITICWSSSYEPFQKENIPEIADFNVLPGFRRQGIGTQLMDRAESEIAKVRPIVGIGMGLTPDYGAAQRLYVVRGYVPDGRGLHYKGHYPRFGEAITVNDHLTLYLTKKIERNS